ncbi:hypothetical protein L486_05189 [Kwoniella mangroviensis CBS 10435]|uniref:Uncharacterized protein n=1 Tax=Kwoniella mangroviensis CBS 10435 TaxID=1331196 RepID=A0A1B9IQ88_9TREE|nr:hypothetical protein L486_05189 [Kwoniella mangroviensis CBS 10435]
MTSASTSSFPEICAEWISCLQRNVIVTLSPVSSTKQQYPLTILLKEPGRGCMLHVPRTTNRSSGGVESRWQMINPDNESIRPYLPTQQEIERVSQMMERERNDPLPRDTPYPRFHQMTLDSATDKSIDTLAVVRPGYTILIPSNNSAENRGIGKKSHYLLLDEDIDFTNADEISAKRFEGQVTSIVESIATPIEPINVRDDPEPKSQESTGLEEDEEIPLSQALEESRISHTDENQIIGDDGSQSDNSSRITTQRSNLRHLGRFMNYLHSKTR